MLGRVFGRMRGPRSSAVAVAAPVPRRRCRRLPQPRSRRRSSRRCRAAARHCSPDVSRLRPGRGRGGQGARGASSTPTRCWTSSSSTSASASCFEIERVRGNRRRHGREHRAQPRCARCGSRACASRTSRPTATACRSRSYLTAFGRHLGFPKPQLRAARARSGLLLDIGKIQLPRELLEKQGKPHRRGVRARQGARAARPRRSSPPTPNFDPGDRGHRAAPRAHERQRLSDGPAWATRSAIFGRMAGHRRLLRRASRTAGPYAAAVSSYEALRSITGWGGDYFHEPLVQQFVSSVGVFPVGSLIELSTGEVAIVVAHNKVRRLKPARARGDAARTRRPRAFPTMLDLLYDPKMAATSSRSSSSAASPPAPTASTSRTSTSHER